MHIPYPPNHHLLSNEKKNVVNSIQNTPNTVAGITPLPPYSLQPTNTYTRPEISAQSHSHPYMNVMVPRYMMHPSYNYGLTSSMPMLTPGTQYHSNVMPSVVVQNNIYLPTPAFAPNSYNINLHNASRLVTSINHKTAALSNHTNGVINPIVREERTSSSDYTDNIIPNERSINKANLISPVMIPLHRINSHLVNESSTDALCKKLIRTPSTELRVDDRNLLSHQHETRNSVDFNPHNLKK